MVALTAMGGCVAAGTWLAGAEVVFAAAAIAVAVGGLVLLVRPQSRKRQSQHAVSPAQQAGSHLEMAAGSGSRPIVCVVASVNAQLFRTIFSQPSFVWQIGSACCCTTSDPCSNMCSRMCLPVMDLEWRLAEQQISATLSDETTTAYIRSTNRYNSSLPTHSQLKPTCRPAHLQCTSTSLVAGCIDNSDACVARVGVTLKTT